MNKDCKHSNVYILARNLRRHGAVSAHEAVYRGLPCPVDGAIKRNTRLAATVHTLRHKLGWDIAVTRESGHQAEYTLLGEGMTPDSGDKA